MPSHFWQTQNDFEYCALQDSMFDAGGVRLSEGSTAGSIVSDVRFSTNRIFKYDEVIPRVIKPAGTDVGLFYRVGTSEDDLGDWMPYTAPEPRIECTLSLTDRRIVMDYDVASISNIFTEFDYRYNMLWNAQTDYALVDLARVDYDPGEVTEYVHGATFRNNMIVLHTPLHDENVNVAVEYTPRHVILDDDSRFIQWKADLSTEDEAVSPVVRSMQINYTLNFAKQMQDAFPLMFRRL